MGEVHRWEIGGGAGSIPMPSKQESIWEVGGWVGLRAPALSPPGVLGVSPILR